MTEKKKRKCVFVGSFAEGYEAFDGQTIKTRILYEDIVSNTSFICKKIDTYKWKKRPVSLFLKSVYEIISSRVILISVSSNGMKLYFPFFYYIDKFISKKVFHFVLGGTLQEHIKEHLNWVKYLNAFEANYVEFNKMKVDMKKIGIDNAEVIHNFKKLDIVKNAIPYDDSKGILNVCTFTRICKEKGIEDAIDIVTKANERLSDVKYHLTIYGKPEENYKSKFQSIMEKAPNYINYGGLIEYSKSTEVLKDYYIMLFPTYYENEGFPGTLIDAFSSGLPVLATDWNFNGKVLEDDVTGWLYPVKDNEKAIEILVDMANKQEKNYEMRQACLKSVKKYLPENAMAPFYDKLREMGWFN